MRSKQLKTVVACVVSAICAIGLFADGEKVATWKGSVSSAWNNPANWVEGVVPGRYITKDENNNTITNGEYGWTARFERSDARWVVEFMGQIVSISNLVFSGASGTTKVGTGASQVLFLEDGGGIYIEESHANHLSIDGSIGIAGQRDANAIYHIRNDSPKILRVKGAFTNFRMDGVWGTPHMRFEGKGKSWLYGGFPGNSGFRPNLDVAMDEGGELHITNTVNNFKTLYVPSGFPKQHIVIEHGSALVPVQERPLYRATWQPVLHKQERKSSSSTLTSARAR